MKFHYMAASNVAIWSLLTIPVNAFLSPSSLVTTASRTSVEHFESTSTSEPERVWKISDEDEETLPRPPTKSRTQRIMEKIPPEGQTGGAGGRSTWDFFQQTEANWKRLRESNEFSYDPKLSRGVQNGIPPPPAFVTDDAALGNPKSWWKIREQALMAYEKDEKPELDYDVVVCGGTLGIFVATALQLKGHDVCVVEGGSLQGREQEWNISMDEMLELVELGVLTNEDIVEAVTTEFPGCRSGFKNEEGARQWPNSNIVYKIYPKNPQFHFSLQL